ncbi:MAG TPA: NAD(P)/FAD-dependent oxidoreductase [Solirubrobacteraceae bacterium]|nr:NAD(P)/FAD-dependent oxidoreductase [Solirubrobacteraceae bacterium]
MVLHTDVAVVGGRVAGAATAILLAERGYRVAVIEPDGRSDRVLSTHVFGDWEAFGRLGVRDAIDRAGAPRVTRFRTEIDGTGLDGDLVVTPHVLALRRERLDPILGDRARSLASVDWLEGAIATELVRGDDGAVTGVRARRGERTIDVHAQVVVGADGRRSFVARSAGAQAYLERPRVRCCYYAYYAAADPAPIPTFEYHWAGPDLVLAVPCDGDLHCIAVLPPQDDFGRWKGRHEALMAARLADCGTLSPRLRDAVRVSAVRGSGSLHSYLRTAYGPGWALVGDAGAAVHPCIGAGIDHAAASADLLARALDGVLAADEPWTPTMTEYANGRDALVRPTLEMAVALAGRGAVDGHDRMLLRLVATLPGLGHDLAGGLHEALARLLGPERMGGIEMLAGSAAESSVARERVPA